MEKIKFTTLLTHLDGTPIQDLNPYTKEMMDLTLSWVATRSLLNDNPSDKLDAKEKYRRYKLARKITINDELELDQKEIDLLIEVIPKNYATIALGRALDLLDPKNSA